MQGFERFIVIKLMRVGMGTGPVPARIDRLQNSHAHSETDWAVTYGIQSFVYEPVLPEPERVDSEPELEC